MPRSQGWVGVGLAAAGATLLAVGAFRQAARATTDPPPGLPEFQDHRREGEDLDARLATSHARLLDKHEITVALIRGQIGLGEAADRFRPIVAGYPAALHDLRLAHPGATETELLYRHVLSFVRAVRMDWPNVAPGFLARLEVELATTFPQCSDSWPGTGIDNRVPTHGTRAD